MTTANEAGDDIMELLEEPDPIKKFVATIVTGVSETLVNKHTKELSNMWTIPVKPCFPNGYTS